MGARLVVFLFLLCVTTADPLKMMMDIDAAGATSAVLHADPAYDHTTSEQLAQHLMVHRHPHELEQQHSHQRAAAHASSYRQLVAIVLAGHLAGLTYWLVLFVKRRPGPDRKLRQPPKRVSCEYNM